MKVELTRYEVMVLYRHYAGVNEMPNGGYVPENGMTLCETCHMLAEQYHISKDIT
jgi:hypothetical protein